MILTTLNIVGLGSIEVIPNERREEARNISELLLQLRNTIINNERGLWSLSKHQSRNSTT